MYSVPGPGSSNELSETFSLQELICVDKSKIGTREKCVLAVTLAAAVLQLYNTPWLSKAWDATNILLLKTKSGGVLPLHYYVSQVFGSSPQSPAALKQRRCVKNEMVFTLGTVLLELSHGQPLLSLCTTEDLNEQGKEDSITEVAIAMRLARNIHEREMDNYARAVQRCVSCNFDTFTCEFEDQEFRGEIP